MENFVTRMIGNTVVMEPAPIAPALLQQIGQAGKPITILAFRSRFTDAEKIAIYTAARAEVAVQVWLDDLSAAQGQMVDLDDPRIIAGVHAMEFGGLIGAGRAAEILT